MVKVFYAMLFTTTLSVVSIPPSFSMDPPEEDQEKFYALGVKCSTQGDAEYNLKKAISYFLTAIKQGDTKSKHSLALTYFKAAEEHPKYKKKGMDLMRSLSAEGSVQAREFRKLWGLDSEDYEHALQHFDQPDGQNLMKILVAEGLEEAKAYRKGKGINLNSDYEYAIGCFNCGATYVGESYMRLLSSEGFEPAKEYRKIWGFDHKDYEDVLENLHESEAQKRMKMLAAEGLEEAKQVIYGWEYEDTLKHLSQPEGQNRMRLLAAKGYQPAKKIVESMGLNYREEGRGPL